jgi:sugar-specific transcriptional regulator TrmB
LNELSLKLALETLKKSLGLTDIAARVYVYLSKKGPRKEDDLVVALNLTQSQLGFGLESLVARRMVNATPETPHKYSAVPLEKVLEEFAKAAKEQAKALQESRDQLLFNQ